DPSVPAACGERTAPSGQLGHSRTMSAWFSNDTVLLDGSCPLPLDLPFTAAIAATLGVSHAQLRRLVARGLVRRVCRGVYAVTQAPDDLAFRARALGLVA